MTPLFWKQFVMDSRVTVTFSLLSLAKTVKAALSIRRNIKFWSWPVSSRYLWYDRRAGQLACTYSPVEGSSWGDEINRRVGIIYREFTVSTPRQQNNLQFKASSPPCSVAVFCLFYFVFLLLVSITYNAVTFLTYFVLLKKLFFNKNKNKSCTAFCIFWLSAHEWLKGTILLMVQCKTCANFKVKPLFQRDKTTVNR